MGKVVSFRGARQRRRNTTPSVTLHLAADAIIDPDLRFDALDLVLAANAGQRLCLGCSSSMRTGVMGLGVVVIEGIRRVFGLCPECWGPDPAAHAAGKSAATVVLPAGGDAA